MTSTHETKSPQSFQTPPLTIRLYGRFVMIEHRRTKSLTFLMPDMTFGGSGLSEHRPFMTIARHRVKHRETTLPPSFRTMTDGLQKEAEDFIWDLSGYEVSFDATGGVTFEIEPEQKRKEIVDLAELEYLRGRKAELRGDLEPWNYGIVRASILVKGGHAIGRAAFHTPPAGFIALSDAALPEPTFHRAGAEQIDIIDITLPAAEFPRVTLKNKVATYYITVNTNVEQATDKPTVALSNLCNALPHRLDVDREFAQYYHVLRTVAPDRLVPKVAQSAGDEDCNRQTKISVD